MKNWRGQVLLLAFLALLTAGCTGCIFIFSVTPIIYSFTCWETSPSCRTGPVRHLIINRLLSERDKRAKLKKLNMVIGTFFSEAGGELLRRFLGFEKNDAALKAAVIHDRHWGDRDFKKLQLRFPGTSMPSIPAGAAWRN